MVLPQTYAYLPDKESGKIIANKWSQFRRLIEEATKEQTNIGPVQVAKDYKCFSLGKAWLSVH